MQSFAFYQEIVDKALATLEFSPEPADLYDPVRYTLSEGGKRLRPVLALMTSGLYSPDPAPVLNPALGLEVFHNFTLLHDDIMDQSIMRRGKATVHAKWNPNVAILSGDAMLILAYQLVSQGPPAVLKPLLDVFSRTALEVCEGQQLDMDFEKRNQVSVEEYIGMIRLKTAVLIAASLQIGALSGGSSPEEASLLYKAGEDLGIAFQLQDDYLDTFGDPAKFGKNIGGDIVANKKTFLLISALEQSNSEQRRVLEKEIQATHFDPQEKTRAITGIFLELGIDQHTRAKTQEYLDRGIKSIQSIKGDTSTKQLLIETANRLVNRES